MAKTKSQKQQNYIECLKTKDKAAYLESEWKQKKKKLEQLKKGEAANKLSLKKKIHWESSNESNFSFSW